MAIAQHILGVRPDHKGLIVDPCLPEDLKHVSVRRKCRGATFELEVHNGPGSRWSLEVNGKAIDGVDGSVWCGWANGEGDGAARVKRGAPTTIDLRKSH